MFFDTNHSARFKGLYITNETSLGHIYSLISIKLIYLINYTIKTSDTKWYIRCIGVLIYCIYLFLNNICIHNQQK